MDETKFTYWRGDRLKELIADRGMRQIDLANGMRRLLPDAANYQQQHISQWVNNELAPRADEIAAMSVVLNCNVLYLLNLSSLPEVLQTSDLTPDQIRMIRALNSGDFQKFLQFAAKGQFKGGGSSSIE